MPLNQVDFSLVKTPSKGILGGSGTVIHDNSFIIGTNITTLSSNTLYTNNLNTIGNALVNGNLTITGNLTARGTAVFTNTIFSTTSALSVVNTGPGPALYVYQGTGSGDIASFYDGDGIEALHVGNSKFTNGQISGGVVGINTGDPNKTLTVAGDISASGQAFFADAVVIGKSLIPDAGSNLTLSRRDTGSEGGQIMFKRAVDDANSFFIDVNGKDFRVAEANVNEVVKLMIKEGGNAGFANALGVGTFSPGAALDVLRTGAVTSDIRAYQNSATDANSYAQVKAVKQGGAETEIISSLSQGFVGTTTNHPLILRTNTVNRMRISSSTGYIGLASDSEPRTLLDLNNGIITGAGNIRGNAESGAWSLWGGLGQPTTTSGGYISLYGPSHATHPNLVTISNSTLGTAAITVAQNSNVGLSKADPSYKLDVNGAGQFANSLHITRDRGGAGWKNQIFFKDRTFFKWEIGSDTGDLGYNDFYIWDAVNQKHRLYIKPDGPIGIGTSDTSIIDRTLILAGDAVSLGIYNTSTGGRRTAIDAPHSGNSNCGQLDISGASSFRINTNSIERMRFTSDGTVFIGTDWPNYNTNAPNNGSFLFVAGTATFGRTNTASEGAQINLTRANDNAVAWALDVLGSSNQNANYLRILNLVTAVPVLYVDGTNGWDNKVGIGYTDSGALNNTLDVYGTIGLNYRTTGSGLLLEGNTINASPGVNADADLAFNWTGYQKGTSRFRNTVVYNGKTIAIASFTGSSGLFQVQGALQSNSGGVGLTLNNTTGYSYINCYSDHVAFTKKTGAQKFYFRRSDTGLHDGPNLTDLLTITNDARVGVGTTAPASHLEVQSSSYPSIALNSVQAGSCKQSIFFKHNGAYKWEIGVDQGAILNNNFYIWDSVAQKNRLYINSDGVIDVLKLIASDSLVVSNVGQVDQYSLPRQATFVFHQSNQGLDRKTWENIVFNDGSFGIRTVNEAYTLSSAALRAYRAATGYHVDSVRLSTNGLERLCLNASGNVGIGDGFFNPDARLHVKGGMILEGGGLTIGGNIHGTNTAFAYTIAAEPFATYSSGAYVQLYGSAHPSFSKAFVVGTDSVSKIVVNYNGIVFNNANVGINTSTPQIRLDVNGDIGGQAFLTKMYWADGGWKYKETGVKGAAMVNDYINGFTHFISTNGTSGTAGQAVTPTYLMSIKHSNNAVAIGVDGNFLNSNLDSTLVLGRKNDSLEGGQLAFCRASDNEVSFYMDAYGNQARMFSAGGIPFFSANLSNSDITFAGNLNLPGDPTDNLHAATKKYVNDQDTATLSTANSNIATACAAERTYTDGEITKITNGLTMGIPYNYTYKAYVNNATGGWSGYWYKVKTPIGTIGHLFGSWTYGVGQAVNTWTVTIPDTGYSGTNVVVCSVGSNDGDRTVSYVVGANVANRQITFYVNSNGIGFSFYIIYNTTA